MANGHFADGHEADRLLADGHWLMDISLMDNWL